MEREMTTEGKWVRVHLRANGYAFSGRVISETDGFLTLEDDRDGRVRIFNKTDLTGWEVLP